MQLKQNRTGVPPVVWWDWPRLHSARTKVGSPAWQGVAAAAETVAIAAQI